MAETKEVEKTEALRFRFKDVDNTTVKVFIPGENGSKPFEATLNNVTWGLIEDITAMQKRSERDMSAIFDFFNEYVEGGTKVVPVKYTLSFFEAIGEYMALVMSTQKN